MSAANPKAKGPAAKGSGDKLAKLKREAGGNLRASIGVGRAPRPEAGERPARAAKPDRWTGLAKAETVAAIPLDRIAPDPGQPRQHFDEEAIRRLAESLKARGQLQPIRVRWDEDASTYFVIMGERRYRAATLAGLPTLTCVVHERALSKTELRVVQLVENCAREDLNAVELAEALEALQKAEKWSGQRLAEETGLSPATVTRTLQLLSLPWEARKHVKSGKLAPSAAYELLKLPTAEGQVELARQAVREGLSRDELSALVRARTGRAQKAAVTRPVWHTIGLKTAGVTGSLRAKLETRHGITDLGGLAGWMERGEMLSQFRNGWLSDAEHGELFGLLAHYESHIAESPSANGKPTPRDLPGQTLLFDEPGPPAMTFDSGIAALGHLEAEIRAATPAPDFTVKSPLAHTPVFRAKPAPETAADFTVKSPEEPPADGVTWGPTSADWTENTYGGADPLTNVLAEWPDGVVVAVDLPASAGIDLVTALERALAAAKVRDGPDEAWGDEREDRKRLRAAGGEYAASGLGLEPKRLREAYTADRFAGNLAPVLRDAVNVRGLPYAVMGGMSGGDSRPEVWRLHPLVPFADWEGPSRSNDQRRPSGPDYYRGVVVFHRGNKFVLGDPDGVLTVIDDRASAKAKAGPVARGRGGKSKGQPGRVAHR